VGAEAALHRAFLHERSRKQLPLPLGQPFERHDLAAGNLSRPLLAGERRAPVDHHRATAATALRTAVLRRRQEEPVAQHVEQRFAVVEADADLRAVERERDLGHVLR
jgi:hypothetical protein